MKFKICTIIIVLSMVSCSKDDENCQCKEYLKTTSGNLALYGSASMQFCDGTLPNPNPKTIVYKKECN